MATASMLAMLGGRTGRPERVQGLGRPIVVEEEDMLAIQVRDNSQVAMALGNGLLIDTQMPKRLRRPPRQAPPHRTVPDPPRFIPRDPEQGRGPGDRAFPEKVDRQPLKEDRELTARLGPRDRDLFHAMLGTLDAGDLCFNPCPQLTRIQVSPPSRAPIVSRRRRLTLRTGKRAGPGIDFHRDLFTFDIHVYGHHFPWWRESQDRCIQLDVAHPVPPRVGRSRGVRHAVPAAPADLNRRAARHSATQVLTNRNRLVTILVTKWLPPSEGNVTRYFGQLPT